ncbi:cytochrome P450 [Pochonia chlamydosporia 170]|uniref:Cytochrome P450 n=1 Tax=Pochonia chlamydosporia 170 TaxID=1380566 RepID=A0A179FZ54_METCM|nr:cytochrome P450 [Pochonia chlamydosporia 170]OAQ70667.2 cytochrome P450 [Pochonia chlamydosporia 170]
MTLSVVGLFAVLLIVYLIISVGRRDSKLPPGSWTKETVLNAYADHLGPPTLPIIGNLFAEWAKEYGEIFSLKLGPATSIVLTSPRLVKQLVDKKSSIYSHRPDSYVGYDIISQGDHLLLMQYSDQWRTCRKLVHQFFMESMVLKTHLAVVDAEAVQLVRDLIVQPQDHMAHPKRFSNMYGSRTPDINTTHMKKLYALMEIWSKVMEPGNAPPVDVFPFLKYLPEKLFGNWRSRAQNVSKEMNSLYDEWLNRVVDRRSTLGSRNCFLDRVLDQEDSGKLSLNRHAVYFLCGTLMEGGSDTTSSIIVAFIHAMTKWPSVMKKAQAEIDAVIGEDRSPTWEDYAQLPYVAACVKETMRWRPVVPLGFAHLVSEDDTIDGMTIPKGSQIFVNAFGMQHDSQRFPDPDTFNPDRYAGVTQLASELANGDWEKRDHYGYGSGRRLCPGIHLAERSLFLAFAKILWALNIGPGVDSANEVIKPDVSNETAYSSGFLVCAEKYPCRITPRSQTRKETIVREFDKATREVFVEFSNVKV